MEKAESKKLIKPQRIETADWGSGLSKRLFVRDRLSGCMFLIDSGADISLLPADNKVKGKPVDLKLFAANNTCINTFGESYRELNLGLRRPIRWNFHIASVPYAIIGADLLSFYGLSVDFKRRRLVDTSTKVFSLAVLKPAPVHSIYAFSPNSKFLEIVSEFPRITGTSSLSPPPNHNVFHHILTTGPPVAERARRLNSEKLAAAKAEFKTLVESGVCRPSSSPWASPIHLVKKKDGTWRTCGDYRRLNAVTIPDKYPTPHLHDCTVNLHGRTFFSSLDLYKAYNQIPMASEDVEKTAVITPFGLFEFLVMPFGLRNASQSFQRYVNKALGDLDFVFVYIDDILIASSSSEEHSKHLRSVFKRLEEFQLRLNVDKCVLGVNELEFLGYCINNQGIRPIPEKVDAIAKFPRPKTIADLRRYLGMINFYHRNVPHAAETQAVLNSLFTESRKGDKREIVWTDALIEAFEKTKRDFANAAMLVHPRSGALLRVVTDASDLAMGAVLEQENKGYWEPLAFFSRKFTPAQSRYSAYDRELTAIFEAIKYFRFFLEGSNFYILTDHKPLTYAFKQRSDKASPRQTRQLSFIAQFSTRIEHISGSKNIVADSLSRIDAFNLPSEFDLQELAEAQENDEQLKHLINTTNHSLKLKKIQWGSDPCEIFCDISGEIIRPYIPVIFRQRVFHIFHDAAHPSGKITDRLIRQRYVWTNMHRDISKWCKCCIQCQQSKISRHVKLIPEKFVAPDGRFDQVHIDIIGPLPASQGFLYCLTMIDRFSRWTEAAPMKNMTVQTVAKVFYDTWISRYGAPRRITSDQGSQFESRLFKALLTLIGCERIRTTPYHPQSNGMIERWHRVLKAAIMCHADSEWSQTLSTVLLGLRTHVRLDTGTSPAEFMFGTTLRLPGEFFLWDDFTPDPIGFINEFREYMRLIRPVPVAHKSKKRAFYYKDLHTCSHVFMRKIAKKGLERPYSGPHKVIRRISERIFEVDINGKSKSISVEHLKPAYTLGEDSENSVSPSPKENSVLPSLNNDNVVLPSENVTSDSPSANVNTDSQNSPNVNLNLPVLRTYSRKRVHFTQ